jgi:hypothetical protein
LETTDDRQTLYRQQLRAYEASRNCLQYENILFFLLTSFLLILHSWLARFEVADLSGIARWYLMQPWCFAILLAGQAELLRTAFGHMKMETIDLCNFGVTWCYCDEFLR